LQVLGGYGYTRDYPLQQFWRDNRLNMIHEGTHGIQSLDLLCRKSIGPGWPVLMERMEEAAAAAADTADEDLEELAASLSGAARKLNETRGALAATLAKDPSLATSNSHLYMTMAGHTVVGWMWLELAMAASAKMKEGGGAESDAFYSGQIHAAKWFHKFEVGKVDQMGDVLASLDSTNADMQDEWM
jgi:butyryl-CoA dehydrogenase